MTDKEFRQYKLYLKFIDGYEKLGKDENEAKQCAIKDMAFINKTTVKAQRQIIIDLCNKVFYLTTGIKQ